MTGDPTSEPVPAAPPEPVAAPEGRGAYVISQLYYYLAAVVGVGFLLGGGIGLLLGVRTLVLPQSGQEAEDAIRGMLGGLAFMLPGLAVVWWHLGQARRREGKVTVSAFWGSALYFHLVAWIALIVVMTATAGLLTAARDAALPECAVQPALAPGEAPGGETIRKEFCYPLAGEAARSMFDAGIYILVAAPIMWWHLRQGRRLTAPPPDVGT